MSEVETKLPQVFTPEDVANVARRDLSDRLALASGHENIIATRLANVYPLNIPKALCRSEVSSIARFEGDCGGASSLSTSIERH